MKSSTEQVRAMIGPESATGMLIARSPDKVVVSVMRLIAEAVYKEHDENMGATLITLAMIAKIVSDDMCPMLYQAVRMFANGEPSPLSLEEGSVIARQQWKEAGMDEILKDPDEGLRATYEVRTRETIVREYIVEAESRDEAKRKAETFDHDDEGRDVDHLGAEVTRVREEELL